MNLQQCVRKKAKLVDPLQFEFSIQAEDLTHYVPTFGWQVSSITDKQKKTIEDFGLNPDTIEVQGLHSAILRKSNRQGQYTPTLLLNLTSFVVP